MKHGTCFALILIAAVLLAAPANASEEKDGPFSIEYSVGAEYDSNVAVLEIDSSSGEGDVAALIDFGLGFDKELSDWFELKLGYDFSQSLHEEFDAFDLRVHRGSGEIAFDLEPFDFGVSYHHADAALDGDEFLVLKRAAPYVSRLFGKTLFLRLEYAHSDKDFTSSPGRDATSDAWALDSFVFLDGVNTYLVLGYQSSRENAIDDAFDYDGVKLKAQLTKRFGEKGAHSLKTGLRYEKRDYATSATGEIREDDRYGFHAEIEWKLPKRAFVLTRFEYNDNQSTLASVDFDEQVVSIKVGRKF